MLGESVLLILLETLMVLRHTVCAFLFSQRQTKATEECFVLAPVSMQKQQYTSGKRRYLCSEALLRVGSELQRAGENDMPLRHVEPLVLTLMQCPDECVGRREW